MMYPFYNRPYMNYYNPYNFSPIFRNSNMEKKNYLNQTAKPQQPNSTVKSENEVRENSKKKNLDFFEILGFKLYYDDLIIIGLIFLLFNEEVNDQLLIISLVLLIGE